MCYYHAKQLGVATSHALATKGPGFKLFHQSSLLITDTYAQAVHYL